MTDPWYQQALTPPTVIEANLRLGVIPSENHCQILVELKDPVSGVQIAQWSAPHFAIHGMPQALEHAVEKLQRMVDQTIEPF